MRLVLVVAALCVATIASAQSQPTSRNRTDADRGSSNQTPAQTPLQITVTTPEPSAEDAEREKQYREREVMAAEDVRDFTRWLTFLTFVQAFIGLIGFGVALRAANAAQVSADIATQTLHISQRAYLNILEVYFDDFGPGKFPTLVVVVRNSGHLPATVDGFFASINFTTLLPNPRAKEPQWLLRSSVAPAGHTIKLTSMVPDEPGFSGPQWNEVVSGDLYVAVYGAMRYQAGFDIVGETGFAYEFKPKLFPHLEFHKKFSVLEYPGYNYSN